VSVSPVEGQFLNLLNQDISLPYCGLQEYIRTVEDEGNCDLDNVSLDSISSSTSADETSTSLDSSSTSFSMPSISTSPSALNDTSVTCSSYSPDLTERCDKSENGLISKHRQFNKRVCYNEGEREMCTLEFEVCPCIGGKTRGYMQRMTGISDLLCNVHTDSYLGNNDGCFSLLAESNGYSI
jgi:hypothetical protein